MFCRFDPNCFLRKYGKCPSHPQETNGSSITKYIYNSSDRLEKVELPDGRIAIYTYDPFGRRIKKQILPSPLAGEGQGEGEVTYYLYADEGLIGEYDSAGTLKKAYGWIPDSMWSTAPIYMYENNQYYFYHNNHLGAPEKITDSNGKVVWSAEYAAFGEAIVNEDPDGDGIKVINNLRLPGQYFDVETGLHYNLHRYFDPKRGGYIQSDRVGLAGGINLYRYALGNPLRLVDEDGLNPGPIYIPGPIPQTNITSGNAILNNTALGMANTAINITASVFNMLSNASHSLNALAMNLASELWKNQNALMMMPAFGIMKVQKAGKGVSCSIRNIAPLARGFEKAFEGAARVVKLKKGQRIYRSPSSAKELADSPRRWFGTRKTVTRAGTESQYRLEEYGERTVMRTYEILEDIEVYYGKVAGGKGYQVYISDNIDPSTVLKFIGEIPLK